MKSLIQIVEARRWVPAKVAGRDLVVAIGDASPRLQLVDQSFDDIPLLVEVGVVVDGSAVLAAPFLVVGG